MNGVLPRIAALVILQTPCLATTIVVIHTPEHIVVATDSLWLSSYNGRDFFPRISCKVRRVGSIYFSVSTLNTDGMQVQNLASNAISDSESVTDAVNKFSRKLDLIARGAGLHETQSTLDRCWNKVCTEVVFLGIEAGQPIVVRLQVEQIGRNRKSLKFIPHRDVCKRKCRITWIIGQRDEISRRRKADPALMNRYSDQELARRLVGIEKASLPQFVGGPIDVLTLDSTGGHWAPNAAGVCSPDTRGANASRQPKQ